MMPSFLARLPKSAFLFILGSSAMVQAEPRTFTSPDGRTLQAEIQSATVDMVTLKLANGQPLTTAISKFSDVDKAFIAEWRKANPTATKYAFAASFSKEKLSGTKSKAGSTETSTEHWLCNLKITNRSGQTLENLKVNYEIFCSREAAGTIGPRKLTGSLPIASIKHLEETVLKTERVTLLESKLKGGYYYADGSRSRNKDSIDGVGITITHNEQTVFEWASNGVNGGTGALER